MKMTLREKIMSGAATCLVCCGAPVFAQNNDGEIIVTARRTEERLQDVPISITVYNQQQIQNRNIVSAADLATYTPSLTANSRFGAESTSFAIRGFVQEGITSPSVAVYFADVVAPRVNGGTTAGNGAGVGSLFDLQNVQVLKGPQGTLFGRNTTGGAVLLVPQKPTSDLNGYIEVSAGNFDMRRLQAVVNVPILDTLRVRLGVDRQTRDGFLRNISGVGPRDFADVDYVAARLSVVADLTPDLENYTIVSYSKSDTNGFLPKVVYAVPTLPSGAATYRYAAYAAQIARTQGYYDVENSNPLAGQLIEQWGIINTTTWRASDMMTVKNIISYQQFQQRQTANINGDSGIDITTIPQSTHYAIGLFAPPGAHNMAQSTFTEELQLQGRTADDRLVYQLGGYLELAEPLDGFQHTNNASFLRCVDVVALECTDVRGLLTSNGSGGNLQGRVGSLTDSRARYRFRNLGAYLQATYKFTDQLSLTAGIRYTSDWVNGLGQVRRVNFPAPNTPTYSCAVPASLVQGGTAAQIATDPSRCSFERTEKSNRPTWLIGLDYKPVEDILLYAKYARGYRQGSVVVSTYGFERWGPEKVDTYEIGTKTSFRGAISGTFNVAAFYNDFKDQQVQIGGTPCTAADLTANPAQCPFIPNQSAGITNTASSTIKGIEVDAAVTLFEGFNLSGGYAYLDTKLKSVTLPPAPLGFRSVIPPVVGGPLPLTPKHKITATGAYTLPIPEEVGKVALSATFSYQSSQAGANATSLPPYLTQPPQYNLNLNLNWNRIAGSALDLQFFVTNLTKERYHLQAVGSGTSNGFDAVILNQPRMFGARARYSFGR